MKEGWKTVKLGEIAKFINGDRGTNYPSKKDYVTDGVPFVNAGNLSKDGLNIRTLNYISIPKYDSLSQGKFGGGDILFCLRGTLGKHSIVQNGLYGAIASSLVIIRASDCCINKYISYFLDYKQLFIEKLNNGAAQPNIPAKTMKEFTIPLPPLSEQVEIVTYLDTSFAKIDAIKANAEKELEEAKKLFAAALNEVMTPKEGWVEKTLGELCSIESKLVDPTDKTYNDLLHVGGANIISYTGMFVDLRTAKEEKITSGKYYFKEGVVLYNKIRPYLVKVARPYFQGLCSADMYPLTPSKLITKDFLFYILITKSFTNYAIRGSARAGMPKVNRNCLFSYECTIPNLQDQQTIVTHLDTLSEKVRQLQSNYAKISSECDALKQAILRDTFE